MNQQEFWNKKFGKDDYLYGKRINTFIKSVCKRFSKNEEVLCVGEGEGRNAVHLAKLGFKVSALDSSDLGFVKLNALAKEQNVEIENICSDIKEWNSTKKYAAIVMSFFHIEEDDKKSVFTLLENALEKEGYLVLEVFSKNQINYSSGGPKDIDLLYDVKGLKEIFKNSTIHTLEETLTTLDEGKGHQGEASVIRLILQKN